MAYEWYFSLASAKMWFLPIFYSSLVISIGPLNEKSRFKKKKWWSIVLCDADNQDEDQELIMAFNFMEVIGNWDETVFMKWWE